MAGVPLHSVDGYLGAAGAPGRERRHLRAARRSRAVHAGRSSAQVVRIVTPGTVTDDALLEERRDTLVAALLRDGDALRARLARSGRGPLHACSRRDGPRGAGRRARAPEARGAAAAEDQARELARSCGNGTAVRTRAALALRAGERLAAAHRSARHARSARASAPTSCRSPSAPPARCCSTCATRRSRRCRTSARCTSRSARDALILDAATRRNLELDAQPDRATRPRRCSRCIDSCVTAMGSRAAAALAQPPAHAASGLLRAALPGARRADRRPPLRGAARAAARRSATSSGSWRAWRCARRGRAT